MFRIPSDKRITKDMHEMIKAAKTKRSISQKEELNSMMDILYEED